MRVIERLAAMSLLAVSAAGAELSPPTAPLPIADCAVQQDELDERIAMQAARVAEDLERRVEALIESRLAIHMAGFAPELPQHFARTD